MNDGAPYDLPYSRKLPPYRAKLLIDLYNYCTVLSSLCMFYMIIVAVTALNKYDFFNCRLFAL